MEKKSLLPISYSGVSKHNRRTVKKAGRMMGKLLAAAYARYPFTPEQLEGFRVERNYSFRKLAELIGGISESTAFRAVNGERILPTKAYRIGKFLAEATRGE